MLYKLCPEAGVISCVKYIIQYVMFKWIAVFAVVLATAVAQHSGGGYGHEEQKEVDYHSPPHYKYEYSVHDSHTHDIKKQEEERKDDKVKGYYSLKEADGTTREVHYSSDKHTGFNAVVHREGHAQHPAKYGSSAESYYGNHGEESAHGGAVSSSSFSGHY